MPKSSAKTKSKPEAVIEVSNLTVRYSGRNVLHEVGFTIPQGHIAAIIGPNGSGKTTLLKAMLGIIDSTGDVQFFGETLANSRKHIGYVPQKFAFTPDLPLTVNEFLNLSRRESTTNHDIHRALHDVGLHGHHAKTPISELSGGQLQRVLIAQAIMNKPTILFLDEPSNNIDVAGEASFYEIITHLNKEHNTTIIMVSHDISTISSLVDTVVCVNGQLLCAGSPKAVLTKRNLTELFGNVGVYEHPHQH